VEILRSFDLVLLEIAYVVKPLRILKPAVIQVGGGFFLSPK
jgi:hypothetical protein